MSSPRPASTPNPAFSYTAYLASYLQANVYLAGAKVSVAILTQPLQTVLRHQQGALEKHQRTFSIPASCRYIINKGGYSGLYNGCKEGAFKEGSKSLAYKGAVLAYTPLLVDPFVDQRQHPAMHALASGAASSFFDTLFGGPLESWATFKSSAHGTERAAKFLAGYDHKNPMADNLKIVINSWYRAAHVAWAKTTIAATAYYFSQEPVAKLVNDYYDLKKGDHKPTSAKFLESLGTGAAVATCSAPIDIVKTIKQMPNPSKEGAMSVLKNNFMKFGVAGLTAGLPLKFMQVVIGWGTANFILKDLTSKSHSHEQAKPQMGSPLQSAGLFKSGGKTPQAIEPVVEVKSSSHFKK